MTTDLKTSLLVNRQVPEFVREEYPVFIQFLEAYYEFLETEQNSQRNDLTKQAKDLRYISDVDASIDAFGEYFLSNFASLIPKDVSVDKAFLIKNIMPLYLSRGSLKSFEFLFRLLYGEEVQVTFPKDNILRASDGKYLIENVLRISDNIYSFYVGDGQTTVFNLAQQVGADEITVRINGLEITSGFYVRKENKKIVFNVAPTDGDDIRVFYRNFDETLLNNRQVRGVSSGVTALIERAVPRLVLVQTSTELYINTNTLSGIFLNAEDVVIEILSTEGTIIKVGSFTVAPLSIINVIDGGSGYNVGDPVLISGGLPDTPAEAIVGSVQTGFPDVANVILGGAGFQLGGVIPSTNVAGTITLAVLGVDDSGANSPNSYTIFTDIIEDYLNITLSDLDYGFPANVIPTGENVSTRISDALSRGSVVGIGPITNVGVLFADVSSNGAIFDAEGAKIETLANTFIDIKTFGSIGRIQINNGGVGYEKGDEIIFGSNPVGTYGFGAAAAVTNVSSTGAITRIEIQPSRISGTANTEIGNVEVVGTGTSFDTELSIGDRIIINSEPRFVNAITSATSLNVNVSFSVQSTNRPIGAFDRNLIGGQNYVQGNFPTLSVSSSNVLATGANVEIIALMGDGEQVSATTNTVSGRITSITITNTGRGYEFLPAIDLSQSGDGNAEAEAEIERSFATLPGRWTTSDSIVSSLERRIQGLDYYIDFTYLTSVATEFSKYKEILKGLLHPAGYKNYAEYPILEVLDVQPNVVSVKTETISGRVSISNGSVNVTGTNTRFNVADSLGILTIGTQIVVNNEIRTVDSIVNDTLLTVSNAFTTNAASQTVILLT
jgi:hypothetical protein